MKSRIITAGLIVFICIIGGKKFCRYDDIQCNRSASLMCRNVSSTTMVASRLSAQSIFTATIARIEEMSLSVPVAGWEECFHPADFNHGD